MSEQKLQSNEIIHKIEINNSIDDITRIVQELTKHSLEPECKHSFKEIMESIFD